MTTLTGFRLHHAVLIERQTLRTQELSQAALMLADRESTSRAGLDQAFANIAFHDRAEGARLRAAYLAFRARPSDRQLLTLLGAKIGAESSRLAAETRVANPAVRRVLIAAVVLAGLVVLLLIWQFELERRAGRIDRDNVARTKELIRLRDEFVAVVSHELRTPLTSIIGYLELIRDEGSDNLTPEQATHLAIVERSTNRLVDLVGDLLLVAETERGPLALDLRPVDLELLAEHAGESARPAAGARGVLLGVERGEPAQVDGDRMRLSQMIDNLVSNAIKFTPAGGTVTVRTDRVDGEAVIEVRDSGLGIPAAERDQVFEPFYRTRGATERAVPGTGLGLSIAKTIVAAHGGRIEIDDGPVRGSTFRVSLPLP